jgi:hypothetical protein
MPRTRRRAGRTQLTQTSGLKPQRMQRAAAPARPARWPGTVLARADEVVERRYCLLYSIRWQLAP